MWIWTLVIEAVKGIAWVSQVASVADSSLLRRGGTRKSLVTTATTPSRKRQNPGVWIIEIEGNGGAIFSH